MEQKIKLQRMSVYFTADLLEQMRQHATHEKRSFNKDVLWLVERALEAEEAQRPAGTSDAAISAVSRRVSCRQYGLAGASAPAVAIPAAG